MLIEVALGALDLTIDAEPPWDAALIALLRDFTPAPEPGAHRPRVRLAVTLCSGPPPEPGRRPPRFEAVPEPAVDRLVDRSESWDADFAAEPATARATARFALRTTRTEPHVQRELVAAALRVALATAAPLGGALLVHASALATEAGALLFLGPSGEGKTTMTRRLPGWRVLADDATLVAPDVASGTPLRGKEGLPRSGAAHVPRGLVFLEKGAAAPRLDRVWPADATAWLLPRIFWYARDAALEARLLDAVAALVERVPAWRLATSLEHDVLALLAPALREAA